MKTKIRKHDFPGDIPMSEKIEMIEGKFAENKKQTKIYKKMLLLREKAIIKENTRKEINEQLNE